MPIPNDNFSNAIALTGRSVTVYGSNVGATGELGEPDHGDYASYTESVWWTWTAESSDPVQIDTIGSSFDTTLGIYTGDSLNQLVAIAQIDNGGGLINGAEKFTFTPTAGTTYRIAVDGPFAATGNIQLNINQESSSAITLAGDYIQLPIDNADADVGQFMLPGANGSGIAGIKYRGVDFFDAGVPTYNYTIAVNGDTFRTNGNGWAIAPTVINQSADTLNQATISGSPVEGLHFQRVISFLDGDKIIVIQDTLTNTGNITLNQVATLDSADPEQGDPIGTLNDVVSGGLVVATANGGGYSVGFGSVESAVKVSADGLGDNTNPYTILSSPVDPNGALDDVNLNLAMNYGSLAPQQSKTKTWYIIFDDTGTGVTDTYSSVVAASIPGITNVAFSTTTITEATVAATTFTITVVYNKAMDTSVAPTIAFPTANENPSNTITLVSGTWSDAQTFVATYSLADVDETISNIDVQISGGQATTGLTQLTADYANALSIDTKAPSIPTTPDLSPASDTGSSNTDNLTNDSTPTFIGQGEIGSTVELWQGSTLLGSAVVGATGSWSITTIPLAQDGEHTLFARARDNAGNVSGTNPSFTFRLDITPPGVPSLGLDNASDTGVSNSDRITNDTTPTFTGTADAGSTVELWQGSTLLGSAIADGTGHWSITTAALMDGDYGVTATATDTAGNISAASGAINFTVDTGMPTIPSMPDLADGSDSGSLTSDNITNDTTPTFTGTADAGTTVKLWQGSTLLGSAIADGTGHWSITTAALADGNYGVSATATDTAGNTSAASGSLGFTIDTLLPTVPSIPNLLDSSDSGSSTSDNITNDPTPTFSGTADAGSTVKLWQGSTLLGSATANASGVWTITTPSLTDGNYTITATATDMAGNISAASGSLNLTIDTSIPAVPSMPDLVNESDTGSSNTDNLTSDVTPTFTGTADAGSTVELWRSTTLLGSAIADSFGVWTITTSTLTNGNYTVTAIARDAAGNTSAASSEMSFTVDTGVPSIPSAPDLVNASDTGSSNTDNLTNDATPTFTGTADAGNTVQLWHGSTLLGSAIADSFGIWTITSSALTDNSYTVTAIARNSAGTVSPASEPLSFTLDTSIPAVPSMLDLMDASDSGITNDNITNDTTPTFTGTADVGSTVELWHGSTSLGSAIATTSGAWTITASDLTQGSYTITATATDTAGNISAASTGLNLTIDTSAPAVPSLPDLVDASDSGITNDNITNDATPTFTGTADAGSTIQLWSGSTLLGSGIATASGAWTITTSALTQGNYTVTATAKDIAGNISAESAGLNLTIDIGNPAAPSLPDLADASDTGSSSSDNLTNDTTPTFTGTADAGSTVELWHGSTLLGSAIAAASGTWTITTNPLTPGNYTVTAKATDIAGNISTASEPLSFTVDTVAPSAPSTPDLVDASDSGVNNDNLTNDVTPTFSGTAEPGSTVELWNASTLLGSEVATASGTWTITANLVNGSYTITATAKDAAGNISARSSGLDVVINTNVPSTPSMPDLIVGSDTGSSTTDNITNDTTPTFTGTADAGTTVELWHGSTLLGSGVTNSTGVWTVTTSTLMDGSYAVTATAKDLTGTVSLASAGLNLTIDTSNPSVPSVPDLLDLSDTGSSSSDNLTNDTTPTFSGTADVGSTVELWSGSTLLGTATHLSSTNWTITTGTLAAGNYTVTAIAKDAAGNVSAASSGLNFTIDTSSPAVPSAPDLVAASDTGSSTTDNLTSDTTPTFSGTAESGTTVELWHGSTLLGSAIATDGTWTITATPLTNGNYTVTATAKDAAGNISAASNGLSFTIDTGMPSVPSTPDLVDSSDSGISTDNITNDATPTFSGTADAGNTVELWNGSTLLGSAIANTSGVWSITTTALAAGNYTVTATARNPNGTISPASGGLSFTLDTTAPSVPSTPDLVGSSDSGISTDNITNDATPTFSGTADAGSTVELWNGSTLLGSAIATASGVWTITPEALVDSNYSVVAKAKDIAGNTSAASGTLLFTVDTVLPAVPSTPDLVTASDSGISTDNITNDATPTFSGTAEAGSTVELWNGSTLLGSAIATASGAWTITTGTLANGNHTITTRAKDGAGNISAVSAALNMTVDTIVPTVAVHSLTTSDSTPQLTGTVTDPTATIQVTVNGNTYTATNNANGTWTLTNGAMTSALPDGTYNVTATVSDVAGNMSSDSTSNELVINTSIPTVTVNPRLTRSRSPELTGRVSDLAATVRVAVNGNTHVATVRNDGSWILPEGTISPLSDGTYSLTVTATNALGNVGTDPTSQELTVDATAPVVTVNTLRTSDSTPTLSGTVNDPTASVLVILSDGTYTATNHGNGTWTLPDNLLPARSNGTHSVLVRAIDQAGNVGSDATTEELVIDTTSLTADIVDVSPDPRLVGTSAIAVNFNKAVTGFGLEDLTLTRDGTPVSLAGASLTTSDRTSWTLGNLDSLTNTPGSYSLTLTAATSGIVDWVGSGLVTNALDAWQVEGETAIAPSPLSFAGGRKGVTRKGTSANNKLVGGNYNDILKGMSGNDILLAKGGQDQLMGGSGNDRLVGDAGNDRLMGEVGTDRLEGGTGNDLLTGGDGADMLLGGSGDDVLVGGTGNDALIGGANKDLFVFNSLTEAGDRIADFNTAEDLIDLRMLFARAEFGGTSSYSRYARYVQLVEIGSTTEVRVDADGSGLGTNFVTLATLNNISSSMINSRHFVIA